MRKQLSINGGISRVGALRSVTLMGRLRVRTCMYNRKGTGSAQDSMCKYRKACVISANQKIQIKLMAKGTVKCRIADFARSNTY